MGFKPSSCVGRLMASSSFQAPRFNVLYKFWPSCSLTCFTSNQSAVFVLSLRLSVHPILSMPAPLLLLQPPPLSLELLQNLRSDLPASIIFLPNPLYMPRLELSPILYVNQHLLRFVECRHCAWTLKELTIQRGRQTKSKDKDNTMPGRHDGGALRGLDFFLPPQLFPLLCISQHFYSWLLASHSSHPFTIHSPLSLLNWAVSSSMAGI